MAINDQNAHTIFLARLSRLLDKVPFEPFTIHMRDGSKYYVATSDHITITKKFREVIYETDEPRVCDINPLHAFPLDRGFRLVLPYIQKVV